MDIQTESYLQSLEDLPDSGQHIIAHQKSGMLVVYQAYNNLIADFAVQNQYLGGSIYKYGRMSWIKPNFLWMMYRCGWAAKENQERVLAIWIKKEDFEAILENAVFSNFNANYYKSRDEWKSELKIKKVRLQWDPDHNPYGNNIKRRAIQLGLKGSVLEQFGKKQIQKIEDITDFVKEQKQIIDKHELEKLLIPIERVYKMSDLSLKNRLGID